MTVRTGVCGLAAVLASVTAVAQPAAPPPVPPAPPAVERHIKVTVLRGVDDERTAMLLPGGGQLDFVTMPLAIGGETVAGAPYSADAVTDVVQTLADGNRIVRQSKAALFRDGRGRTRREQGVAVLGNLVGGGDARTQVQIHDPDAGTMFLLDSQRRVARRLPAPRALVEGHSAAGAPIMETVEMTTSPGAGRQMTVIRRESADAGRTESLGRKTIEGVDAEGSRSTVVIPTGQIGNEQPITILYERWYSPELKVLVMSRQSDPRFGETTYRLTNLVRAEPAPELFRVPPDYEVVDGIASARETIRLRRKRE